MRDRIAHARVLQFLDARDHEAHFARGEFSALLALGRKDPHLFDEVIGPRRHERNLVLRADRAVHNAHEHHDTHVVVEPRVDYERLKGSLRVAFGRRHVAHDALEDVVDPHAGLRRAGNGVRRVNPDHILDFFGRTVGIRALKVHFVQNRNHLDAQVDRGVAVRYGLRFDHKERTFASGKRTAHFVGKVDVPRGIDEVEFVDFAVFRLVFEGCGLRLDGDAAFALKVHAVQDLFAHFSVGETPATLNESVGERGLAVVDVGDDRKIPDVLHRQLR